MYYNYIGLEWIKYYCSSNRALYQGWSWDRFPDNAYIDKMHCKSLCIKVSAIVNIIYNANLQLFPMWYSSLTCRLLPSKVVTWRILQQLWTWHRTLAVCFIIKGVKDASMSHAVHNPSLFWSLTLSWWHVND